ncbi:MGMT family protein [Enterovibrio paralichthyis]|uniref:MGMT family protein n=1 Tax=Enterovibrio paralichthyis TaxID=2853805 RepID=UPI0006CFEBC6|nr:MGMT family protein [Enterovibrio paralichthyis]MBV7297485.1 MGMT family protein [Enterovibrio paralichthyis]
MPNFDDQIYAVLIQIPAGKVTTYGNVAKLAGFPRHARHVGKLLSSLPKDTRLPWFRVINASGMISLKGESFERQREKLLADGIEVKENGAVSLRRFLWDGEPC